MAIQHEDITDPKIHEPKGASTATENEVYVSDGAGSGEWKLIPFASLEEAEVRDEIQDMIDNGDITVTGRAYISAVIADVSTASSVILPLIRDCTVVGASFVLGGPITDAEALVTVSNAAGASLGAFVAIDEIAAAKGDQYAFTATTNNVLTGPTWIEVATDGASTGAVPLYVTVEIEYVVN